MSHEGAPAIASRIGLPAPPVLRDSAQFLERCPTCAKRRRACGCLHDIRDPGAFVHATINDFCRGRGTRAPIALSLDERDELHCEGLAILHKLAAGYHSRLDGYEVDGRFSGYAASYLPKKLGDAWHKLHSEHMLLTQPDQTRRWHYGDKAVSLEAIVAENPDGHPILASSERGYDLGSRLRKALVKRARAEQDWIVGVAKRIGQGQSPASTAAELGISEDSVRTYMRSIVRAAPAPDHQFAKISELRLALDAQAVRDAETAAHIGELLGDGASTADIAELLSLEPGEVRDHEDAIRRVWHSIESEST